MTKYLI
ncbi:response regulator, partial [Vibrio harveyi]